MAKTGEGEVKKFTKIFLEAMGLISSAKAANVTAENTGWYHMPVSNGMGVAGINDFYGHYRGRYFTIETKDPEAKGDKRNPTALQQHQINATRITGAKAFVVRELDDLEPIMRWFEEVDRL